MRAAPKKMKKSIFLDDTLKEHVFIDMNSFL
jgi:hypothetical protein